MPTSEVYIYIRKNDYIIHIYISTVYIYIYLQYTCIYIYTWGSENRSTPNHPNLDHFSIETHGFGDIYVIYIYIHIYIIHIHIYIYIHMYISLSLNVRTVFQHPSPDSLKKPRGACTET